MSLSYRWIRSHRHFIGMARQNVRTDNGSEVLNNIHLLDVGTVVIFDRQSYKASGPINCFGNVTYLANPAEMKARRQLSSPLTSTKEFQERTGEPFLSIGDQYSIRIGGAFAVPLVRGLGM